MQKFRAENDADRRLWEALAACLIRGPKPPSSLPLRECRCGSLVFKERIVRYWGWGAALFVNERTCQLCGVRESDGHMIVEEPDFEVLTHLPSSHNVYYV